jgi:hypothetical protein
VEKSSAGRRDSQNDGIAMDPDQKIDRETMKPKKKSMEIQHGVATCGENPNRAQTNSNLYSQGAKAIIYSTSYLGMKETNLARYGLLET